MTGDNGSIDYDAISRIYDVGRAANIETLEKLVKLLHVDRGSILLDMGCGTGNYAAALHQIAKSVIGIDISVSMIEQAQAKFPELQLVRGDVACLPFDSEKFDGVFAVQVFHHVKNKEAFIREAHRVLRRKAYIGIHFCSHKQMQAFWFYHYFPRGLEVDLTRIPDATEIDSLLERAGFSDVGIEICYNDAVVVNETPARYLEKNYRDSISTFALLTEEDIKQGCEKLRADIASGIVESIVRQSEVKVTGDVGGSSIIYGLKSQQENAT